MITSRHGSTFRALLAGFSCIVALTLPSCEGRPRLTSGTRPALLTAGGDRLVSFDLSTPLAETRTSSGLFPLPVHRTFTGFSRMVVRAHDDQHAKGFFIRLGLTSHGWTQVEELSQLFRELRDTERPIYCHADGLDNAGLWLAAQSCDKLWLSPAGSIESVGLAGQSLYMKSLLDRFKVRADFLNTGRYKSFAETITRDGPSEDAEESLRFVLGALRAAWLDGVSTGRPDPQARAAAENGPWHPKAAHAIGLIDGVGYESEARAALEADTGVAAFVTAVEAHTEQKSASEIAQIIRLLAGATSALGEPHVAVLPAAGGISMAPQGMFDEGGISAKSLTKIIRRLRKQDETRAVVLRIDSPGGSALASDLLWHELRLLAEEKPLIASVGGMAASGGYYLACAARKIVAERTSIVGSIGVVGGKLVLDEALAEYGIFAHTFAASDAPGAAERAAYLSPFQPWDDLMRGRVQEQMDAVYDVFLDRVAQGRGVPIEQIRAVAEGRIWSGEQGKERALVDEIGGLDLALKLARDATGLPEGSPVTIEGDTETLLELLGLGDDADEATVRTALEKKLANPRASWWAQLGQAQRSYLQSLAPLLHGETTVAALPFAIQIK